MARCSRAARSPRPPTPRHRNQHQLRGAQLAGDDLQHGRIVVQPAPGTDSGFQQLTIDQTNGAFSPGAASESGLAEIEISMRTGGGNDALNVIGTPFRDVVRLGMGVGVASAASVLDLNGDGDEDVLVSQAAHISVKGQGGDDNLSARGIPGVAGPSIRPVALHGGANNDELAVSNAVGSLNPRDLLIGDAGIDFLDLRDGGVDTGVGGADFDVARIDAGRDGVVEVESTQ